MTSRLHFHLPPTEKRNSCRPFAGSLAHAQDIFRTSRVDYAKGFSRWQLTLQMGYTCLELFTVSFRSRLVEKSSARVIVASLKFRTSIILSRDLSHFTLKGYHGTWYVCISFHENFVPLSSSRNSNAVAALFITTANNNPFYERKKTWKKIQAYRG